MIEAVLHGDKARVADGEVLNVTEDNLRLLGHKLLRFSWELSKAVPVARQRSHDVPLGPQSAGPYRTRWSRKAVRERWRGFPALPLLLDVDEFDNLEARTALARLCECSFCGLAAAVTRVDGGTRDEIGNDCELDRHIAKLRFGEDSLRRSPLP